jgi:S-adenosylmethionine hydrolase
VHVAVVDPGVGSSRRALAVQAGKQFFVGPDNGLFSFVYEREKTIEVVSITNRRFFREPLSRTFHGRDLFAPVAGAILNGVALRELGDALTDYVRLPQSAPHQDKDDSLAASVIHVDRFGNLITNITRADLREIENITLEINQQRIVKIEEFFAAGIEGEIFAIWGSAGHLEIVARSRSAAEILNAGRGATVFVRASQNYSSTV